MCLCVCLNKCLQYACEPNLLASDVDKDGQKGAGGSGLPSLGNDEVNSGTAVRPDVC